MAYDANKKVKLGQLETTVSQVKTYIDTQISNIPADQFLDTANTKFEYEFAWTQAKYPNSTNPNLEGKAVLVMVLKNNQGAVSYSFLDLSRLIDVNKIDKVKDEPGFHDAFYGWQCPKTGEDGLDKKKIVSGSLK